MGYSPLAVRTLPSTKYDNRNGTKITRLIIHHTAGGTNEGNEQNLAYKNDDVSANYLMRTDGTLTGIVDEVYRAWTTGYEADLPSITIETVNTGTEYSEDPNQDWVVSEESVSGLVNLAADLSMRHGWGPLVVGQNLFGHRDFMNTHCPGDFLYTRLTQIAERANAILGHTDAPPPPAPQPPQAVGGDRLWQGYPVPDAIAPGTGYYYGSISGPEQSLGGYYGPLQEIKILQQRLIVCGFVPGITDPNSDWADGIFDTPADAPGTGETSQAVIRFQNVHMVGQTQFPGACWFDDWLKLFNL